MRDRFTLILGTFTVAVLCGFSSASGTEDATDAALVLRNGNLLVGAVTAVDGGYDVAMEGAVLHVPESDVALVASSLLEEYDRRRAEVQADSAPAHLELARWCLRYELWPQAAREILDARGLDSQLAQLVVVEQQLTAMSSRRDVPDQQAESHSRQSVRRSGIRARDEAAMLAASLPPGAVEQFVDRVQPVLVNSCTAGGCHRTGGPSEFQLSRALLYDEANRQTTMQNLAATFGQIDRTNPRDSPLVRMAVLAHGGSEEPPLAVHRRELKQELVRWAELLADNNAESAIVAPSDSQEAVPIPTPVRPNVKRGAFSANHPRARGRHGSPNVKFGLRLKKVEEPKAHGNQE